MINSGSDDVTRRWTLRLTACLVAGTAVLTGCSEKQEARQSLPATSSAAPTEDALPPLGPADFPVPAEARERTPDGAVEFVRYYVALTKHIAETSHEAAPLLQLSDGCRTCERIAESMDTDRLASYRYREYAFQFEEYGPALLNGDTAEIGFQYTQGPITVVDTNDQVVPHRSSPTPQVLQSGALLEWKADLHSWILTGLTVG